MALVTQTTGVDGTVSRGPDAVAAWITEMLAQFADLRFVAERLTGHGDKVLVAGHQNGRGRQSGVPVEMDLWHVWTFRERKVVEVLVLRDGDQARRAAEAG